MIWNKKSLHVAAFGGIGDCLMATPAFRAIKAGDPKRKLIVYYENDDIRDIFLENPYIDSLRKAFFYSSPIEWTLFHLNLLKVHSINYPEYGPGLFYHQHACNLIADMLGVQLKDDDNSLDFFLTEREEQEAKQLLGAYTNPVTFHVTSKASANQHWPRENWEELIERMPDYTFIQLGGPNEIKIRGAVDLLGKTSLRMAVCLLKFAHSFVGVCSSFAHATNAVNTNGVILFGPSSPSVWGYSNNINLYEGIRCAPCIALLGSQRCPYDRECMKYISVEKVQSALLSQIKRRVGLSAY